MKTIQDQINEVVADIMKRQNIDPVNNSNNNKATTAATGPKTEEGKKISAQNSYKHGLTSSVEARFNLQGEAKNRFDELLAVYREEFKIQGQLESDLLLQYVWSVFSMERATRLESELDFSLDNIKNLERIQLYRQRHERNAMRLKKELGIAQKDRYAANEVNRMIEKQGYKHNISTAQPTYDLRFKVKQWNLAHCFSMHRDGLVRWPGEHNREYLPPGMFEWCAEQDLRQAALVA